MSVIQAVFEKGLFRPTLPVDLPEGSVVDIFPRDVPDAPADADSMPTSPPSRPPLIGSGVGMFTMSPDFDEPLEDFKDYT